MQRTTSCQVALQAERERIRLNLSNINDGAVKVTDIASFSSTNHINSIGHPHIWLRIRHTDARLVRSAALPVVSSIWVIAGWSVPVIYTIEIIIHNELDNMESVVLVLQMVVGRFLVEFFFVPNINGSSSQREKMRGQRNKRTTSRLKVTCPHISLHRIGTSFISVLVINICLRNRRGTTVRHSEGNRLDCILINQIVTRIGNLGQSQIVRKRMFINEQHEVHHMSTG